MKKGWRKPALARLAVTAALVLVSLVVAGPLGDHTVQADDSTDGNCRLFSETGYKVCGRFLQYWQVNGGLTQQGYPVSDVFEEKNAPPPAGDGKVYKVQYFQRARFEYHPENKPPYDVLLGLLGTEQLTSRYPTGAPNPVAASDDPSCQLFNETGYKVCGKFLQYWQVNGGLAQQGLPVSDVFEEKNAPPPAGDGLTHKVQYFQRARFEMHDENQPPFDVLLGLLGTEQFTSRYTGLTITPVAPPPPIVNPGIPLPNGSDPIPPPPVSGVRFLSVRGGLPGQTVSAVAQTVPFTVCSVAYINPAGQPTPANSLVAKTSDSTGVVGWEWLLDPATRPGTGSVTVSCTNQGSLKSPIIVGRP